MKHPCKMRPTIMLLAAMVALAAPPVMAESLPSTLACRIYAVQRDTELAALKLVGTAEVRRARAAAAQRWREQWGTVTPEMERLFPGALDELVFNAALKTVVGATYPSAMVMMINRPSRHGATTIPGTRYGWDNTDNIYGTIAIDPRATYRISGQMTEGGTNLNLSLWSSGITVLSNLAKSDIRTDAYGRFSLSAGMGEGFDLRLSPDARRIMVRETMADWATDKPIYIEVEWTGGPAPATRPTRDLAAETAAALSEMVEQMLLWRKTLYRKSPANIFVAPWMGQTGNGGLPNQAYAMGHFAIADDEALVFEIAPGGAQYFSFQLSDIWGTSGDFVGNVSTLTNGQSWRNGDGSYTYVLAIRDPGVQNWISTQGWREGDITLRWQQITSAPGSPGGPAVKVRHIKLAELASILPAGTPSFGPAQRKAQIAQRARNPFSLWMDETCAR